MKIIVLLVAAFAITAKAYPADPKDDVELVPPKNTNAETFDDEVGSSDGDDDGRIPVIIIRTRPTTFFGGRPSFLRPPSFFDRHFGFGSSFPLYGGDNDDDTEVSLDDIFGVDSGERRQTPAKDDAAADEDDDETSKLPCGFLCSILKGLEDHINQLEKDFQATVGKRNKTDSNDYDVYNETYTEKTLSDGSVVKINRTVIADTDENGNSFFFHSTLFGNPGNGKEYDEEEEEGIEHEFTDKTEGKKKEVPAIEYDDEKDAEVSTASTTTTSTTTTTTKSGIVPRVDQEEEDFNDVFADVDKGKSQQNSKGVDDGLVTVDGTQ